jgi:hypothetical protein
VNDGQQQEREESKDEKKGKGTHSHFWWEKSLKQLCRGSSAREK